MNIYRALTEVPADLGPTIATIGNFDGVHRAHQWVIAEVIARARALGQRSIAITFDPHPVRILRPERQLTLITPLAQKLERLAATGIDAVLILPFDETLARTSARDFAERVLQQTLHVTEVHEGENFRFGYQAEGGIESLQQLGQQLGFTVRIFAPQILRGQVVSSSRIRQLIAEGHLSQVRALLGRPFAIDSTPAPGRGYGLRFTVPTINLAPYADLLPAHGVYVTTLETGHGTPAAETFQAVTNIGNRPTFGADSFTVESHLLNFHPLEGAQALTEHTPLRLTFLKRLRPEIRWPNPEALKAQITRDVTQARRLFHLCALRNA
jgi:riboflavin kinase/FMN adenylyltransferase